MTDRRAREKNPDTTGPNFEENEFGDATVIMLPAKEGES
jgi:hypothetical protein